MRSNDFAHDSRLIHELSDGQEFAFREIFDKYYESIYCNIFKIVQNKEVAQDLTQEIFFVLWKQRKDLKKISSLENWLFTISYNKSISFLRKKKFSVALIDDFEIQSEDVFIDSIEHDFQQKSNLLKDGLMRLPKKKRDALILYKIYNYNYKDIALKMGISKATAEQYVKLAMAMMRQFAKSNNTEASILMYLVIRIYYNG